LVLIALYIVSGAVMLALFPVVTVDESWYTQSSWSLVTKGTFALPMFGDLAGFDQDNVVYGRIYLLLMGLAYQFADVNVSAIKAVSFVSGLVAVAAVFGVGQQLWSRRVGAIAAVLLAVAPNVALQALDARPEVMLVAASTVALYLVLSGDLLGSRWRVAAGGLVVGLGVDVHLNGVVFPPALLLMLLWRRSAPRSVALYVLGLAAALLWWLWIHVLPDPSLFAAQVDAFTTDNIPLAEVLSRPAQVFGLEMVRFVLVTPRPSALLTWIAALAVIELLRHNRDQALTSLLVYGTTVFILMALVLPHRINLYAILLWPVFALLAARLLDVSPRRLAAGLGSALVVVSVATLVLTAWQRLPSDYDRYVERLREHIPPEATVQGDPLLWFGFSDQPFIASHYFVFTGSYEVEARRQGIDYIVLDEPTIGDCPLCSYTDEVREFLEEHAELVAVIQDPYYGSFAGDGEGFATPIYRVSD
jgi:4-amino-4-deoxy-L-arabinose transferase-like glycosyltransferase